MDTNEMISRLRELAVECDRHVVEFCESEAMGEAMEAAGIRAFDYRVAARGKDFLNSLADEMEDAKRMMAATEWTGSEVLNRIAERISCV